MLAFFDVFPRLPSNGPTSRLLWLLLEQIQEHAVRLYPLNFDLGEGKLHT